jgi:hypothetical protein
LHGQRIGQPRSNEAAAAQDYETKAQSGANSFAPAHALCC